jgi:hypothetical protein
MPEQPRRRPVAEVYQWSTTDRSVGPSLSRPDDRNLELNSSLQVRAWGSTSEVCGRFEEKTLPTQISRHAAFKELCQRLIHCKPALPKVAISARTYPRLRDVRIRTSDIFRT